MIYQGNAPKVSSKAFMVRFGAFGLFLSNLWVSGHNVKILYRFGAIASHMKLFENNTSAKIPFKEDFWQICIQNNSYHCHWIDSWYIIFLVVANIIAAASGVIHRWNSAMVGWGQSAKDFDHKMMAGLVQAN